MGVRKSLLYGLAVSVLPATPVAVLAAASTFKPNGLFQGSSLHGWHSLGGASWSAEGDRIPDFIVGKMYWTHRDNYFDPDPYGEAVLYWYQSVRDKSAPGGARSEPHRIDNHSGGGSDIVAADMNKDVKLDIITSTRFGTFIFWNQIPQSKGTTKAAR